MSRGIPKYEKSFAYYIEVELGLDINKIWNFEKNTVSPYEIYKSGKKKVWLYCLEKDYHNYDRENNKVGYQITCSNFYNGQRCGYCNSFASHKVHWKDSFAQWGIDTFGEDFLKKYWGEKNTKNPYEIAPNSRDKIWVYCQNKDYHNDNGGHQIACYSFYGGQRCGYCGNHKTHKLDSLAHLYPQIAEMIVADERNNLTIEDLYKISSRNHKKFYFKCKHCNKGSSQKKELSNIIGYKFSCEYCSDGISVPEKFTINILEQLNLNFITQLNKLTFKWCENYRYDFYIPTLNMIIETHGLQHYENGFKKELEETELNDRLKKELALNNNINNYIVIDCRYSKFDWLKENAIKELSSYFNLSNINWELAWSESQKSLIWEAKKMYDLGYTVKQIAEELKLDISTIYKHKEAIGIKTRNETKQENLLKTKELLQQNKSTKEIAEVLNISIYTVYKYKKELNL